MPESTHSAEITAALNRIRQFVEEITGKSPGDAELAWAMTRYFVLKEICDHIDMKRHHASP